MKQKWKYFLFSILPFAIVLIGMQLLARLLNTLNLRGITLGGMDFSSEAMLAQIIVCVVLIILFGLIWFRRSVVFPPKNRESDDSVPKRIPRKIISVLLLGFSLDYLGLLITYFSGLFFPDRYATYSSSISGAFSGIVWVTLLYAIILGPVLEELIFRGLVFGYARKVFPTWLAILFQAALFGIYHWNLIQGIYAFVLGIFFGYICLKGPGIRYSIPCHMMVNFITYVLSTYILSFLSSGGQYTQAIFIYIVGIVGTILFMLLFNSATKVKKKQKS